FWNRITCRQHLVWQYWWCQPARFYLYRTSGQSDGAAGEDREPAASNSRGIGRIRRSLSARLDRTRRISRGRVCGGAAHIRPAKRAVGWSSVNWAKNLGQLSLVRRD